VLDEEELCSRCKKQHWRWKYNKVEESEFPPYISICTDCIREICAKDLGIKKEFVCPECCGDLRLPPPTANTCPSEHYLGVHFYTCRDCKNFEAKDE